MVLLPATRFPTVSLMFISPLLSLDTVTADTKEGKLVLLYHMERGPSDKSFGIDIAELAGFPWTVVEVYFSLPPPPQKSKKLINDWLI